MKLACLVLSIALASLAMGVIVFVVNRVVAGAMAGTGLAPKLAQVVSVGSAIAAGVAAYALLGTVLCRREFRELLRRRQRAKGGR